MLKSLSFLSLLAGLSLSGCGGIKSLEYGKEERTLIKEGYNPQHITSCGTIALYHIMEAQGIDKEVKEISKSITKFDGLEDLLRGIIGFLSEGGNDITFPSEIERYLKENLSNVIVKDGSEEEMREYLKRCMEEKAVGIALVRDGLLDHHWTSFPRNDPFDSYGYRTKIIRVYTVSK